MILTYLYNPGSTVITRTPNFAISCLRPSENAIHAFLDMEYAANAGTVNLPIKRVKTSENVVHSYTWYWDNVLNRTTIYE